MTQKSLSLEVYNVDSNVRWFLRHSVYSDSQSRYAQRGKAHSREMFTYFFVRSLTNLQPHHKVLQLSWI